MGPPERGVAAGRKLQSAGGLEVARGAAGVLASIAAVPDVEAVDLMSAVHRRLVVGATLAHALHAARGSLDVESPGAYVIWYTFTAHGAA